MNKDLIELQRGNSATCVVIKEENYRDLGQALVMDARSKDELLFAQSLDGPAFKERLEGLSSNGNLTYFVIKGIDQISIKDQNRYVGLIKDREFLGHKIPDNVIITLTVSDKDGLKRISRELYHFCVVAF